MAVLRSSEVHLHVPAGRERCGGCGTLVWSVVALARATGMVRARVRVEELFGAAVSVPVHDARRCRVRRDLAGGRARRSG